MTREQRKYPRIECSGTADVTLTAGEPPLPADIVNLSAGGCLLVLKEPRPLSQDTVVELTFRINNLHKFQASGLVKAKRSDTAVGFQFPFLSHTLHSRLRELISHLIENLPAPDPPSAPPEKRRHPRLGCVGPAAVQLAVGEPLIPATIVDLSAGGCRVVLRQPQHLPKDTLVELTFAIHHLPFRVRGQVKANGSDTTIGFQFTVLTERTQRQVEDVMNELVADIRKRQGERHAIAQKVHY
ncbi:MAG: PilZ domain-containing protein [Terracidiphilus sp.]|jgi:c-di-GMP-binding flagellar brake protein YcgR